MMHGRLKALPAHVHHETTPVPGPWSSRVRRPLFKQRRERYRYRSLIYKLPVFRWSGATARYSHFNVPVETGTPPRRRKVQPTPLPIMAKTSFAPLFLLSKTDPLHWVPFWTAALPPEKENVCSVVCLRDSVKSDRTGTAGAPVRMRLLKDYIILSPVQGTPHQRCQR